MTQSDQKILLMFIVVAICDILHAGAEIDALWKLLMQNSTFCISGNEGAATQS
jgi:hypothetical protein